MGLISPPKWPSVNPFSHPLGSKIGRKPMVNPSKWVNLKSNFLKFHHRNQVISGIEKARKMAYFRAFLALLSCRLSLAELGCTTCSLQTVLLTFLHTRIAGQEASLLQADNDYRPVLKAAGFLTRDPRMKERKKYGLKAARRAPQFSKR